MDVHAPAPDSTGQARFALAVSRQRCSSCPFEAHLQLRARQLFRNPKPLSFRGLSGLGAVLRQLVQCCASSSRAHPLCNSAASFPSSSAPSHLAMNSVATPLPMTLINAPPSEINRVTGGRDANESQVRQLLKLGPANTHLVGDHGIGIPGGVHHLFRRRVGAVLPVRDPGRASNAHGQAVAWPRTCKLIFC
ncbi:hypothetical protein PMI36_04233 [Pseudomonas sp. GM79]|nr:hypothetical protein PMI36_04233 [Pseudomonas sp. GM79]